MIRVEIAADLYFVTNIYILYCDTRSMGAISLSSIAEKIIDDIRGACAVKGKVQAGQVKRVDHGDAFDALLLCKETLTGHYFILKFDLSWGIRTNMGKTEGIFHNLQCDCHRVASIFINLINHRTDFSNILSCCEYKETSINTNVDGSFQWFQRQFSRVKIGCQNNRLTTLVPAASVRWRTLADIVYYAALFE